jgi:meso-butanediol dehydrogenase/(S,S)-butanediol dehydrogenase/diacetyl reductase
MSAASGSEGRFAGRVVLVTGGTSDIGRACAERLVGEGARVAVADLDGGAAQRYAETLPAPGPGDHVGVALDVTDREVVDAAVGEVVSRLGGLDVLVNVAGGDVLHPAFEDTEDAVWTAMLDLNLVGVVRCCRAAVPHLRRSTRHPAIVTISSVNALTALGSEPYASAKAGLGALTLNLAASLGPEGIRVNAVAPGTIATAVWHDQPGGAEQMRHLYPLGRVGQPADVAAAVAFLASADASWVTGHTLPVDGGLLTGGRAGPG